MSGITNATATVQNLTALLGAINPLVAAGMTITQALIGIFRQRGQSAEEAATRAAEFEKALAQLDAVSQRVIDKGEERLRELNREAGPFNGPRDGRED